jgi:hypothetical protein
MNMPTVPTSPTVAEEKALTSGSLANLRSALGLNYWALGPAWFLGSLRAAGGVGPVTADAIRDILLVNNRAVNILNRLAALDASWYGHPFTPATINSGSFGLNGQYPPYKPFARFRQLYHRDDRLQSINVAGKLDAGAQLGNLGLSSPLPRYTAQTYHRRQFVYQGQKWTASGPVPTEIAVDLADAGVACSCLDAVRLNLGLLLTCNNAGPKVGDINGLIADVTSLQADIGQYADEVLAVSAGWDTNAALLAHYQTQFPSGYQRILNPDGSTTLV